MEQFWLESGLTLLLVLTVIAFWRANGRHRGPQLPPGPFAWPVVGNLLQLGTQPHRSLAQLSRKYGPLMRVKFGSVETVIVSSPDMAKEILQTYDQVLSSRPKLVMGEVLFYNGRDIAFAPMGPEWRKLRKVMTSELFNGDRIASFQRVRKEEMFSSLNSIFQGSSKGRLIQVKRVMLELTFNIITRMMINKKYFGDGNKMNLEEVEEFEQCRHELLKLGSLFNISDLLPSLRRFDLQGIEKQLRALHERFDKLLQTIIDDHRAHTHTKQVNESEFVDFIDIVMNLSTQNGQKQQSDVEKQQADAETKAMIMDVFIAGTETLSTTLEWTFTELFHHPEELRKVQQELGRVVGRERLVEESDLPNLPCLRNVIKETFRVHPTAPFMLPHEATEACKISGYDIPAKTRIMCNLWAIGMDPTIWGKDVDKFKPQRFEKLPNMDWKGRNFELIPFGSGRRICPGMNFADILLQYVVAQWLHAFDWTLPYGQENEDIDMAESFGLTLTKSTPLEMCATPRVEPSLYQ